jgi:hypothetical protein
MPRDPVPCNLLLLLLTDGTLLHNLLLFKTLCAGRQMAAAFHKHCQPYFTLCTTVYLCKSYFGVIHCSVKVAVRELAH